MVKNLFNYLTYIPKKLVAIVAMLVLVLMPLHGAFADNVQIEGRLAVANYTNQDNQYQKSVGAKAGDVVKFQIWYHNKEEADSGKVAQNLKVDVNMPTAKGATQTVNASIAADNSNTVNDSATVQLNDANAYLEFIPGSVDWRHNAGTNENPNWVTQNISDNVVTGGATFIENAQPCFNFEANITFFARVKVDQVNITKQVRKSGEKDWKFENTAKPGETLEYQITVRNQGNSVLDGIVVADKLPAGVTYIPGSTMIKDGNFPSGVAAQTDTITTGGLNYGKLGVTGVAYFFFKAKVNEDLSKTCQTNVLENTAAVQTSNAGTWHNKVKTTVEVTCQPPVTPPVTPPTTTEQLPNTGIEGPIAGLLGSGGLGVAIRSYIRSRRGLAGALLDV